MQLISFTFLTWNIKLFWTHIEIYPYSPIEKQITNLVSISCTSHQIWITANSNLDNPLNVFTDQCKTSSCSVWYIVLFPSACKMGKHFSKTLHCIVSRELCTMQNKILNGFGLTFFCSGVNRVFQKQVTKRKKILTKIECWGAKFSDGHDLGALDPA